MVSRLFQVDHPYLSDLNDIAVLENVFHHADFVDERAAMTLGIEEDIAAKTQSKLEMMAGDRAVIDHNVIVTAAADVDEALIEWNRWAPLDGKLRLVRCCCFWHGLYPLHDGRGIGFTAAVAGSDFDGTTGEFSIGKQIKARLGLDVISGAGSQFNDVGFQYLYDSGLLREQAIMILGVKMYDVMIGGDGSSRIIVVGTGKQLHCTGDLQGDVVGADAIPQQPTEETFDGSLELCFQAGKMLAHGEIIVKRRIQNNGRGGNVGRGRIDFRPRTGI